MVVVAVRDAGNGARAARLGLRVLVAAGFGLAAWIVGMLLSGPTASADETQPAGGHDQTPRHNLAAPKLLSGLADKLTGVIGTVGQVTTELTQITQAVVEPVQTTIELPAVQTLLPLGTHIGDHHPVKSGGPRPDEGPARAEVLDPPPPPPDVAPAAVTSALPQHPSKPRRVTGVQLTQSVARPDSTTHARQTDPAPPPLRSGDQAIGVAATHDGGAGKHPFIVLGPRLIGADLRPGGVAAGRHVPHISRNAALPTTSPD